MRIGIGELVVVFLIALVVIGPDKLPEYAKQLGKALSELRKSTAGLNDEIKKDVIVPLNEAAKPLKDAVEPVNDSVSQIKSDMNKVSKTLNDPASAAKEAVMSELKRDESGNSEKGMETEIDGVEGEGGLT